MRDVNKASALAELLDCYAGEIVGHGSYYSLFDQEFLVMSEAEADTAVIEAFPDQVLGLDDSLLLKFCLPGVTADTLHALRQEEHGTAGALCLLRDIDALRETAIDLYGRAKFLAAEDENEIGAYLIYRLN